MKNLFKFSKIFSLILLFVNGIAVAQDYSHIDQTVRSYPKSFAKTEDLAAKIAKDFAKEEEKARAIFYWIATNIKYDVRAYYSQVNDRPVAYSFRTQEEKLAKQRQFKLDLSNKTFKSKKAVCQGYTALFDNLSELVGLESVTVTGTAKTNLTQIGKLPGASDHAWNAVKINRKWFLVEPTWASGVVDPAKRIFIPKFNDGYFLTSPELFILNHFPDDKKWLFGAFTEQDFADFPLYFGEYIRSGYTFINPTSGVFKNSNSDVISFKIEDFNPADKITFAFSSIKQIETPTVKFANNAAEFDIILPKKSNGYLTIYVNNRGVVAYKIQR